MRGTKVYLAAAIIILILATFLYAVENDSLGHIDDKEPKINSSLDEAQLKEKQIDKQKYIDDKKQLEKQNTSVINITKEIPLPKIDNHSNKSEKNKTKSKRKPLPEIPGPLPLTDQPDQIEVMQSTELITFANLDDYSIEFCLDEATGSIVTGPKVFDDVSGTTKCILFSDVNSGSPIILSDIFYHLNPEAPNPDTPTQPAWTSSPTGDLIRQYAGHLCFTSVRSEPNCYYPWPDDCPPPNPDCQICEERVLAGSPGIYTNEGICEVDPTNFAYYFHYVDDPPGDVCKSGCYAASTSFDAQSKGYDCIDDINNPPIEGSTEDYAYVITNKGYVQELPDGSYICNDCSNVVLDQWRYLHADPRLPGVQPCSYPFEGICAFWMHETDTNIPGFMFLDNNLPSSEEGDLTCVDPSNGGEFVRVLEYARQSTYGSPGFSVYTNYYLEQLIANTDVYWPICKADPDCLANYKTYQGLFHGRNSKYCMDLDLSFNPDDGFVYDPDEPGIDEQRLENSYVASPEGYPNTVECSPIVREPSEGAWGGIVDHTNWVSGCDIDGLACMKRAWNEEASHYYDFQGVCSQGDCVKQIFIQPTIKAERTFNDLFDFDENPFQIGFTGTPKKLLYLPPKDKLVCEVTINEVFHDGLTVEEISYKHGQDIFGKAINKHLDCEVWDRFGDGSIGSSTCKYFIDDVTDFPKDVPLECTVTYDGQQFMSDPVNLMQQNIKDLDRYSDKTLFLTSDEDIATPIQYTPAFAWKAEEDEDCNRVVESEDICTYPFSVFHSESGNVFTGEEIDPKEFDNLPVDTIADFVEQYKINKIYDIRNHDTLSFNIIENLDVAHKEEVDINYWQELWKEAGLVVAAPYVDETISVSQYKEVLYAAQLASMLNAPLVLLNSENYQELSPYLKDKLIIAMGDIKDSCPECFEETNEYIFLRYSDKRWIPDPSDPSTGTWIDSDHFEFGGLNYLDAFSSISEEKAMLKKLIDYDSNSKMILLNPKDRDQCESLTIADTSFDKLYCGMSVAAPFVASVGGWLIEFIDSEGYGMFELKPMIDRYYTALYDYDSTTETASEIGTAETELITASDDISGIASSVHTQIENIFAEHGFPDFTLFLASPKSIPNVNPTYDFTVIDPETEEESTELMITSYYPGYELTNGKHSSQSLDRYYMDQNQDGIPDIDTESGYDRLFARSPGDIFTLMSRIITKEPPISSCDDEGICPIEWSENEEESI